MQERIFFLIKKSQETVLTEEEEKELHAFFLNEANREVFNLEMQKNTDALIGEGVDPQQWEPVLQRVLSADGSATGRVIPIEQAAERGFGNWWKYAAAVAVMVAAGGFWLSRHQPVSTVKEPVAAIMPAANKPILRMSNGKTIVLSDASNGIVSQQGSMTIVKLDSELLAFKGVANSSEQMLNTLITPKGRQYSIILPDGTKVWMNAMSELTFPSAFNSRERTVTLSGEAYFEIAAAADHPFVVNTRNQRVQVLGTSFNVSGYEDEAMISTTLITGKVKVSAGGKSAVLLPGQQLQHNSNSWQVLQSADTDAAIAWKNGYFSFNKANIDAVMRQLERWYDINIVIETKTKSHQFVGEIPMNVTLEEAMSILKHSGINYAIKGRTVTITD
ncbi:MAG: FecR domain-containing protein [Chitinophaga sp.]|uniref:FecR family protein n=1 Tax=Chitinophaga sp. TaxID=1869181 RepID=UPI001B26CAC0|nr:FecR family protein [Chitinophaga sp.]MBO9732829.1 FecR domain-containing protein [Chitinophaga sp.]